MKKILSLALLLLINAGPLRPAPVDIHAAFHHISLEDGLSQSTITGILHDSRGFLWFATQEGLNRYDGYTFKIYRPTSDTGTGISGNIITGVIEAPDGNLWIGTALKGLNRFDPRTERFTHYKHIPGDPGGLSFNNRTQPFIDSRGSLWVGTGNGLNRFIPDTGKFKHYLHIPKKPGGLIHNNVSAVYEEPDGTLWVGTPNGINRLNREKDDFTGYRFPSAQGGRSSGERALSLCREPGGPLWVGTSTGLYQFAPHSGTFTRYPTPSGVSSVGASQVEVPVTAIVRDSTGILWFGFSGSGLKAFEPRTKQWFHFPVFPAYTAPYRLTSGIIESLYIDRTGLLWAGTSNAGVFHLDKGDKKFRQLRHEPGNRNSLGSNIVYAFSEDGSGHLWIGTRGGGVSRLHLKSGEFTIFRAEPDRPDWLYTDTIDSLYHDKDGFTWIGTSRGLYQYDPAKNTFLHYYNGSSHPQSFKGASVQTITQDSRGFLWFGTMPNGLERLNPSTGTFTNFRHRPGNPGSLSSSNIRTILEDGPGFWIGTAGGGLNLFDPETGTSVRYMNEADNSNSLSNDNVMAIYRSVSGILWLGTFGGGLNRFDPAAGTWAHFREKDGLANDTVYGILADDKGFLWLSTNKGLSRFDPGTAVFNNYTAADGLQSLEFNNTAFYQRANGEMFFGGLHGITRFFPGEIKDNPYIPPVVVTEFRLFYKPVEVGKNSPLSESIAHGGAITLSHRENVFSFTFSSLNYLHPGKNLYRYKLEGFDRDWVTAGASHRTAGYTNLAPGKYVFRVKGSNNDGKWNEAGVSVTVLITPPFWETWWFRIFLILLVVSSVYSWHRWRMRNLVLEVKTQAEMNLVYEKYNISTREQEIIELVLQGKTNKEIEDILFISVKTVKNHIYNVFKKVGVGTRLELIHVLQNARVGRSWRK